MDRIRATSTRRDVIATSKPGKEDASIRLTNPNSKPIPRDEVELFLDVPEDVRVTVGQTAGDPTEDEPLTLLTDLPANTVMELPVNIHPQSEDPNGEINITIKVANQPPQRTTISYGISEDHSGTTNIG